MSRALSSSVRRGINASGQPQTRFLQGHYATPLTRYRNCPGLRRVAVLTGSARVHRLDRWQRCEDIACSVTGTRRRQCPLVCCSHAGVGGSWTCVCRKHRVAEGALADLRTSAQTRCVGRCSDGAGCVICSTTRDT